MSMDLHSSFEATVVFVPPEEGGRSAPARTGYRALLRYGGIYHDSFWEFDDALLIEPGAITRARIGLLHPELLVGRIAPGDQFEVCEGVRVVGRGTVSRLLGPAIEDRR